MNGKPPSEKFSAGQACAFGHRFEFGPGNFGMSVTGAQATVGAPEDSVRTDQTRVLREPIGDQTRMLNDVAGVSDHARHDQLAGWELDCLERAPLPRVAIVGRLE